MTTKKRVFLFAIFLIPIFIFLFYQSPTIEASKISYVGNRYFPDYKIVNYSNILIASKRLHKCEWKPDLINDGFKICTPELIIWNKKSIPVNINMSNHNFDFAITRAIKKGKVNFSFSTDFNVYKEERLNKTDGSYYDASLVNFTNWKNLDNLKHNIPSDTIVGLRMEFQLPQYQRAFWNFTYKPLNFLLDPTISACGTLNTQHAIYTLTDDILSTNASCMDITQDNITFNLDSYSLRCDECESTSFSGIQVTDSSFVTIGNGTIEDYGIGIEGIDSNNFIENIVIKADTSGYLDGDVSPKLYGFSLTGVFINISNVSINKLIDTRSSSIVYGIYTTSNNNQIWNSTIKGVDGGSATEYGIFFDSTALHNVVYNTVISNISNIEIGVSGNSLNNSFVNCTYTNETVNIGSELLRKWYFDAQVNYTHNSSLVEGANITAWNITGDEIFSVLTGGNGKIETQDIIEYVNTGGTKSYFSNYTMNASFGNWDVNSLFLNITATINQQFNISDSVNPDINITKITTSEGSKTISFNSTASDGNLESCYYSIFNSTNEIDGTNENISMDCNILNFAITSSFGTLNLTVYANDTAGNDNSSTKEFIVSEFSGGGGGAGGTANFISTVALLKHEEDKSLYSKLDRAKIYKAILTPCESKSSSCKLSIEEIIKLQLDFEETYSLDLTLEKIVFWFEQFNNNEIENVEILEGEIKKWGLVTAIVQIIETPFSVNPKTFDTFWFVVSDTFNGKVRANKVLKSCTVEGDWSCNVDGSVSEIIFKLDSFPPIWYTQSIETTLTYISIDDESVTQKVLIRAINYRKFFPVIIIIGIIGFGVVTFIYSNKLFKRGRK